MMHVQQTDATGKKKDGVFLANDLSAGIEKIGAYEVISRAKPNGQTVEKKSSNVIKIVIHPRSWWWLSALPQHPGGQVALAGRHVQGPRCRSPH